MDAGAVSTGFVAAGKVGIGGSTGAGSRTPSGLTVIPPGAMGKPESDFGGTTGGAVSGIFANGAGGVALGSEGTGGPPDESGGNVGGSLTTGMVGVGIGIGFTDSKGAAIGGSEKAAGTTGDA